MMTEAAPDHEKRTALREGELARKLADGGTLEDGEVSEWWNIRSYRLAQKCHALVATGKIAAALEAVIIEFAASSVAHRKQARNLAGRITMLDEATSKNKPRHRVLAKTRRQE